MKKEMIPSPSPQSKFTSLAYLAAVDAHNISGKHDLGKDNGGHLLEFATMLRERFPTKDTRPDLAPEVRVGFRSIEFARETLEFLKDPSIQSGDCETLITVMHETAALLESITPKSDPKSVQRGIKFLDALIKASTCEDARNDRREPHP